MSYITDSSNLNVLALNFIEELNLFNIPLKSVFNAFQIRSTDKALPVTPEMIREATALDPLLQKLTGQQYVLADGSNVDLPGMLLMEPLCLANASSCHWNYKTEL